MNMKPEIATVSEEENMPFREVLPRWHGISSRPSLHRGTRVGPVIAKVCSLQGTLGC